MNIIHIGKVFCAVGGGVILALAWIQLIEIYASWMQRNESHGNRNS